MLRRICDRAFAERYSDANGDRRLARERLDDELALIDHLGLAGFFLLHHEVLELAREVALRGAGPGLAARDPAAGARPRGARSARSSAT